MPAYGGPSNCRKCWITRPRIVEPPDPGPSTRPLPLDVLPLIVIPGTPGVPVSVVPSISTGAVITGSGESVVLIVTEPSDGIAKAIMPPPAVFAALMASRNVQSDTLQTPSSWSSLVLTTNGNESAAA